MGIDGNGIDGMVLEIENNTQNANAIKNLVLDQLLTNKIIEKTQHTEYTNDWQVIVIKKGWFRKLFKNKDDNKWFYKFVKFNFN